MAQAKIFLQKRTVFTTLAILSLSATVVATADEKPASSSGSWGMKMQGLYRVLAETLTDTTNEKRFADPANRKRIQKNLDELAKLSHGLKKENAPDADPTLPLVAGMLAGETKRASSAFRRNYRDYARGIVQSLPGYCITCHTRNASGPKFDHLPIEPSTKALSPFERAEFFAATRQFDRAESELKSVLNTPANRRDNWQWKKAVYLDLSIAVRVKNDPNRAEEIVESVLKTEGAPLFMKEDAKTWKQTVAEWKAEAGHTPKTQEGLRAEAARLMAKAKETQAYPMDRTADIYFLRAGAAVHDFLQGARTSEEASDGLLLAGISAEVLSPLQSEDLHESFYEMCVRRSPHTAVAQLCYRRLEGSVLLGFTGSAGTDLPPDAEERLRELRNLATPIPIQKLTE